MTVTKPKRRDVAEVIAAYLAGEFETRNRRHDGVTTRTNYSGANTRWRSRNAATAPIVRGRRGSTPR